MGLFGDWDPIQDIIGAADKFIKETTKEAEKFYKGVGRIPDDIRRSVEGKQTSGMDVYADIAGIHKRAFDPIIAKAMKYASEEKNRKRVDMLGLYRKQAPGLSNTLLGSFKPMGTSDNLLSSLASNNLLSPGA